MHTGSKGFESKCGYITSAWRGECLRGGRRDKLFKDKGRGEKFIKKFTEGERKWSFTVRKRWKKQGSTFRQDVDSLKEKKSKAKHGNRIMSRLEWKLKQYRVK